MNLPHEHLFLRQGSVEQRLFFSRISTAYPGTWQRGSESLPSGRAENRCVKALTRRITTSGGQTDRRDRVGRSIFLNRHCLPCVRRRDPAGGHAGKTVVSKGPDRTCRRGTIGRSVSTEFGGTECPSSERLSSRILALSPPNARFAVMALCPGRVECCPCTWWE